LTTPPPAGAPLLEKEGKSNSAVPSASIRVEAETLTEVIEAASGVLASSPPLKRRGGGEAAGAVWGESIT